MDQIQQTLVPDVIGEDWKKWWEAARSEMKRDGHFIIPTKKSEPILLQEAETSLDQRLMTDFRAAKGLKARTTVAAEIVKCFADLSDKEAVAREVIQALNTEVAAHMPTMPALALEGIFLRDDIRQASGQAAQPGEPTDSNVWATGIKIHTFFEEVSGPRLRRALDS